MRSVGHTESVATVSSTNSSLTDVLCSHQQVINSAQRLLIVKLKYHVDFQPPMQD